MTDSKWHTLVLQLLLVGAILYVGNSILKEPQTASTQAHKHITHSVHYANGVKSVELVFCVDTYSQVRSDGTHVRNKRSRQFFRR